MKPSPGAVLAALAILSGAARAEEPGVAAVASARASVRAVIAAAAAPTTTATAPLADALDELARVDPPAAPAKGQALDSAAQPWAERVEPRLQALRERILDRRHRFLTGADRPAPPRPALVSAILDLRSVARRADRSAASLEPIPTEPSLESVPARFDLDLVQSLLRSGIEADATLDVLDGVLHARVTERDLARVRETLGVVRAACGRRLSVDVSAWRLAPEVAREAAASPSPEAALARAASAGKAALVARRSAVLEDGALAHLAASASRTFLAGAAVEATGVVPVVNPVVRETALGLRCDVRAMRLPGDGREPDQVRLDLDLALRELRSARRERVTGHELELPETAVTRCATTLIAPLGGAILAGGTVASSEGEPCVFLVRVLPFEAARPTRPPRAGAVEPPPPAPVPGRPEVAELDALLALVDDAWTKVRRLRRFEVAVFDARDVLEGPHVRTAPRLGLEAAWPAERGAGAVLTFGDDRSSLEGPLGIPADELESIVKGATGADDAWREPASYVLDAGHVMVWQTPGTIAAIGSLLAGARRERAGNVAIEAEWLRLDDALAAESGGVLAPDAVARLESAVATGERAARVAAGFVVAQRGDVGVVHGGLETVHVAGFERASGGTGFVVETVSVPTLGRARQGFTLEALGRGDAAAGPGALVLDVRVERARVVETATSSVPAGTVTRPVLEEARAAFDGLAPGGALLLVAGRRPGEPRPVLAVLLKGVSR